MTSPRNHTANITDALKRLLKSRGLTYQELAARLQLSEASVKRVFAEETFTLQRVGEICEVLEIDFFELAKLSRKESTQASELSIAQETALAKDPRLLGVFYLSYNDLTMADMVQRYHIEPPEAIKHLVQLDKLGLIDLLPENRIKLRAPKMLRIRSDGPLRRVHGTRVVNEFLAVEFDQHQGHFRFEIRELGKASAALMHRKLERLADEFTELAELDNTLPVDQRESVGFALGIRPWKIDFATGLKPRPAAPAARRVVDGQEL